MPSSVPLHVGAVCGIRGLLLAATGPRAFSHVRMTVCLHMAELQQRDIIKPIDKPVARPLTSVHWQQCQYEIWQQSLCFFRFTAKEPEAFCVSERLLCLRSFVTRASATEALDFRVRADALSARSLKGRLTAQVSSLMRAAFCFIRLSAKIAESIDSAKEVSMLSAMDAKLKKRKLDALRRGIHRIGQDESMPCCVNLVGVGKAGAAVVAQALRSLPPHGPKMTALVVDIGEQDLQGVREAAAAMPADRAAIEIIALDIPSPDDLLACLARYRDFLKLEYPMAAWSEPGGSWLASGDGPAAGAGVRRAYAKALYGRGYYDGERVLQAALRRFGARVGAAHARTMVCMIFGLSGGTGSGMIVDMARHLTNVVFGRQALVVGVAILPCDGDPPDHGRSALYATLNELDCLGDEAKNGGVVRSCGELFRNPFTAGFLVVPQQTVWTATGDLTRTHSRVTAEVASLLTARDGANLWETLRLLNWVAAPSTQHSAARTPWGAKWIHMFGFVDAAGGPVALGPALPRDLGLLPSYRPEFIEARMQSNTAPAAVSTAAALESAFMPDVTPQVVDGGPEGSIQFLLPSIAKTDLALFFEARDVYDASEPDGRILDHALLLDQGVLLSEPSTRLAGMAGASLAGGDGWVAVSLDDLRGGGDPREDAKEGAREVASPTRARRTAAARTVSLSTHA